MNSLFHERKSHRITYPNSRLLQPARTCMHAYWQNMQTSASMQERVCPTELELKDRENVNPFCSLSSAQHVSHTNTCITLTFLHPGVKEL